MPDRFTDWCINLKPTWVGFLIWMSTVAIVAITFGVGISSGVFALLMYYPKLGVTTIIVLLVLPVLYAWYVAIFRQ